MRNRKLTMKKPLYIFLFFFVSVISIAQTKEELRVFSFDNLTKKPLQCDHYYCSSDNKLYKIHPTQKSSWFFEKEKNSHYGHDYRKFSHVKVVSKGYLPQVYTIDQMLKMKDTANIYLQKMHKDFNYNFTHIIFKEDLSIDQQASKYYLNLYKEYFLAKSPRLKIVIVNVHSPFAITEESKTIAANNLRKLLGSEERVSIKIDNSLKMGTNNEVVFKVLALPEKN